MVRGDTPPASVPESRSRGGRGTPPANYWTRAVSGKEGIPPQTIGSDAVVRGGRGNPFAVSLMKIDN